MTLFDRNETLIVNENTCGLTEVLKRNRNGTWRSQFYTDDEIAVLVVKLSRTLERKAAKATK